MEMRKLRVILQAAARDDLDFTLIGTRHIIALSYGMAVSRTARAAGVGDLAAAYAEHLGCRKSAVYNAARYAIMAAGLPTTVAETVDRYAALAILEGAVYRG
jgi:hypothetical protein